MYNSAFYPTPPDVAAHMLSLLGTATPADSFHPEPSAGKGDLADAAVTAMLGNIGVYGCRRATNIAITSTTRVLSMKGRRMGCAFGLLYAM